MPKINYSGPAMAPIPAYALDVLQQILTAAGVESCLITCTTRDPANQARIMFNNLEQFGVAAQKKLYKPPGQEVIDVYASMRAEGHTPDDVKAAMTAKILELGAQSVSKHCGDANVRSVFDVAPSSIPTDQHQAFETAVSENTRVDKFLKPPIDPAYHIEIPA
jgi:hypothetical protein